MPGQNLGKNSGNKYLKISRKKYLTSILIDRFNELMQQHMDMTSKFTGSLPNISTALNKTEARKASREAMADLNRKQGLKTLPQINSTYVRRYFENDGAKLLHNNLIEPSNAQNLIEPSNDEQSEKKPLTKVRLFSANERVKFEEEDLKAIVYQIDDLQDAATLQNLVGRATFNYEDGEVTILAGDESSAQWLVQVAKSLVIKEVGVSTDIEVKVILKKIKFFVPKGQQSELHNLEQKLATKNGLSVRAIKDH